MEGDFPLRAHAYQKKVAGRNIVTGDETCKKLRLLQTEVQRRPEMPEFEKNKHVLEVITQLQDKFYQKFRKPEEAHCFFDVNGARGTQLLCTVCSGCVPMLAVVARAR
jgi:hypothetical protein